MDRSLIGATISHYHILSKIGEGGMGVVYKAEDTRLHRIVALKFLSADYTADSETKQRFIREARTASALDHSNICTIYDIVETDDGHLFIAMAHYSGSTLKDRLKRGPLQVQQAVDYAVQIAEGLSAAHSHGIIHRDLKPANIFITEENVVKILDFGVAKLTGAPELTRNGVLLGTTHYMAPEQLTGQTVDQRADIWALGVIFYEMLTGKQPFDAETDQALLYAILEKEPEYLSSFRTETPEFIQWVISKILAKDPKNRYQHINEIPVDLKSKTLSRINSKYNFADSADRKSLSTLYKLKKSRYILAFFLFVLASTTAIMLVNSTPTEKFETVRRWDLLLPENAPLNVIGSAPLSIGQTSFAISPDGSELVYTADNSVHTQLHLRYLDRHEYKVLPGTEGAYHPFFSPDGQWIGFFAEHILYKLHINGGNPIPLCEVNQPMGADWGTDNAIIIAQKEGTELCRVSDEGGNQEVLSTRSTIYWPEILPGNKWLLSSDENDNIHLVSLEGEEDRILLEQGTNPRYLQSEHILFNRRGSLFLIPFELSRKKISGDAVPVLNSVRSELPRGAGQYTFAEDGTLIYISSEGNLKTQLVWIDRNMNVDPLPFSPQQYSSFHLSEDGKKLAVQIDGVSQNIWVYDLVNTTENRLTYSDNNIFPVWTPDGQWIVYTADLGSQNYELRLIASDGSGLIKSLPKDTSVYKEAMPLATSWTPGGDELVCYSYSAEIDHNIYIHPKDSAKSIIEFVCDEFNEWGPAFSPDGKWIAYTSDEEGMYNVYVQPYPATGARWKVSTSGGEEPVWSSSTPELFYRNGRTLMGISYTTDTTFNLTEPQLIFNEDFVNICGRSYDIHPNGQKFLIVKYEEQTPLYTKLSVVTNLFAEMYK